MLYARTNAEAHGFMDLAPCGCGDTAFERRSAPVERGDTLCSKYLGERRTCGTIRTFVFELPRVTQRPVAGRVVYGGDEHSRPLDPGHWMAAAEDHTRLQPGTAQDLAVACAALEEILKFIPAGADWVPGEAFTSEADRQVLQREPGRFRKLRLKAVLATCRDHLGGRS